MRIRAVRPDFWGDDTLAHLPDSVRLFYIGLWCVADDAGWFEYRPGQIGANLYPYRTAHRRERDIEAWTEALISIGRVVRHPCGCALIPTLTRHQKMGGQKNYQARDKHIGHTTTDESVAVRSATSKGKEREGKERGGMGGDGSDEYAAEVARKQRRLLGVVS